MSNGKGCEFQASGASSDAFALEVVSELDKKAEDLFKRFNESDPSLIVYTLGAFSRYLFDRGDNIGAELELLKPITNNGGETVWQ